MRVFLCFTFALSNRAFLFDAKAKRSRCKAIEYIYFTTWISHQTQAYKPIEYNKNHQRQRAKRKRKKDKPNNRRMN